MNRDADLVLGVDVGTSGVGVVAMDREGEVVARADHEVALLTPRPGWTEQHPAEWLRATEAGLRAVAGAVGGERIAAIGLAGQMHGMVPMSADDGVVRPAILWNDQRTAEAVAHIEARVPRAQMIARGGNPPITGFQVPKVIWLRDVEPASFAATRRVLLPKDYVGFHLTGVAAAEPSDASGTGVYHLAHRAWDEVILEALELDPSLWPPLQGSDTVLGGLRGSLAAELGLAAGTPVVIGSGDNAAAATGLALGRDHRAVGSVSLGTSGVLLAPLAEPTPERLGRAHLFAHADGGFFLLGVTLAAGGSIRWFRDAFAPGTPFDSLMGEAAASPVGARGVTFMPYLAGERTPYLSADLRGAFHGLSLAVGRGDLVRAVLEGVVCSLRDAAEVMAAVARPSRYLATGGGARSDLWLSMIAAALRAPVGRPANARGEEAEVGASEGAGFLAWRGVGHAPARAPRVAAWIEPDPVLVESMETVMARYRAFTPA
jgi:xylulokinase